MAFIETSSTAQREVGRDVRAHGRDVRRELRRLRDDRGIDVADLVAARVDQRRNVAQEHAAVGALPPRVGVRKVRTDVAQRERAQQRVADRVQQHVGVGMPGEPARMRDRDAAQHERPALDQRVHVESGADAHRRQDASSAACAARIAAASARSSG